VEKKYYVFVCVCACVPACIWLPGRVGVCMRRSACGLDNPACNAYASYCDVICDPSVSTIFFRIINDAIFGEKKMFWNIKCLFSFCLQLLSKTFPILRIM
jgi:hypothetical protein